MMTVYTRHQTPPTPADPPGPAGLWMPWYTGLGEVCNPCVGPQTCKGFATAPPGHIQITVEGIVNGTGCSGGGCANANGTFVLDFDPVSSGTGKTCRYCKNYASPTICGSPWGWSMQVVWEVDLGGISTITATLLVPPGYGYCGSGAPHTNWSDIWYPRDPFQWAELSGIVLTNRMNDKCNGSSATFTIDFVSA